MRRGCVPFLGHPFTGFHQPVLQLAGQVTAPKLDANRPSFLQPYLPRSYLDMLERMTRIQRQRELRRLAAEGGEAAPAEAGGQPPPPLLSFTPSYELSKLARPQDRRAGRLREGGRLTV